MIFPLTKAFGNFWERESVFFNDVTPGRSVTYPGSHHSEDQLCNTK